MYSDVEGYIAPCLFGGKEKRMAFLLYSDNTDDILIQPHQISPETVSKGGKMRVSGNILLVNGIKEMSVDHYTRIE